MASFTFDGIDGISAAFTKSANVPDSVKKDILKGMADISAAQQKSTGENMGVRDPDSDVHILDHIKVNSPKLTADGGSVTITFSGTRTRNGKKVRNAEIAFINEFGASGKGIPARPFIKTANEKCSDKTFTKGEKIFNDWLTKNFEGGN